MRQAAYILFATAGVLAGCREWSAPVFEGGSELPNVTIGDLRAYYRGAELTIADDIVISGRVVSSDRAGNFYNTFFIDDGTGAAEIMAGMPDLDAVYHPGQKVSVRARGLAVGWRDGAMQLGLPPEPGNRYPTGYFYHPAVIRAYVSAERDVEPATPVEVGLADLAGIDDGAECDLCGRLVRIARLTLDPFSAAETWAATQPSPTTGYVKFRTSPAPATLPATSPPADSITVVTSGYASFALAPLPRETVTLTGILLYGKGGGSRDHYLLKLRDEEDIEF